MKLGEGVKVKFGNGTWTEAISVEFDEMTPGAGATAPAEPNIPALVASILEQTWVQWQSGHVPELMEEHPLGNANTITAALHAWIYQDGDAHDTCSLTACLNPLHPGPCKGWKGTLFKAAPNAFHALEAARVEKANAARVKKIQALKEAGKPIPKKLLTPIVAKPHPHAGKTAGTATGEAHAAGKAVSDAAGVNVNEPGKMTLGQAIKQIVPTDATPEKGPKGKKPTVASKGIAAVIAQEKVTPQYKLDKAAKITPEQWNALSGDEKAIIRGELTKIQKEGFGPQQKKATELLDALPANGLKGGGTDTVTTPKGQVIQKIEVKEAKQIGGTPTPVASEPPKPKYTPEQQKKIDEVVKAAEGKKPEVKEMTEPGKQTLSEKAKKVQEEVAKGSSIPTAGAGSLAQANAIKNITEAIHGPQTKTTVQDVAKKVDIMKGKTGQIEDHPAFGAIVGKLASQATAKAQDQNPGKKTPGVDVFYKEIAEHIKGGKAFLPPEIAKIHAHNEVAKAKNVKEGIEKAAKDAHDAKVAESEAKIKAAEQKLADVKAKREANQKALDALKKHTALETPDGIPYTTKTPTNIVKDIQKNGHADLILDGKKIRVGFENSDHPGKLSMTNGTGIDTFYTVKEPDGTVYKLAKGEHIKVALPSEPTPTKIENAASSAPEKPAKLPAHVQHAIDMANGTAPGASWSKLHLAAYEKLSPEEFQSLSPDVQGKIVQELKKGTTKFLDSKKIAATKDLLAKFDTGKPKPPAGDVGFHSHMADFSITDAQAKKAVAHQPVAAHAQVAKELAGLGIEDQPDVFALNVEASKYGSDVVAMHTKDLPLDVAKNPEVLHKAQELLDAAIALKKAQLVGTAKKNAYNKIDKVLHGDQGKLSPMQKASLAEYQKYLLHHPTDTEPEAITKLQYEVVNAGTALNGAIMAAKDAKNPSLLPPAQVQSKAAELLGPEGVHPKVNLTMDELKKATENGKKLANLGLDGYSPELLANPNVAAKKKALEQAAVQLNATAANQEKLNLHLANHHEKALNSGADVNGNALTETDVQILKAHAEQLKKEHEYLDTVYSKQMDKTIEAKKELDQALKDTQIAQSTATVHEPVKLSDYDQATISEVYGNAWGKAASAAVTFGVKDWSTKAKMKEHPDYPSFTQDLGNLQQAVKQVALAHAVQHTAELNVPTDPDTGAKLDGPEKKAWLAATMHLSDVESEYSKLHKATQAKLDKIRTDIGLNKRALPKVDSPAVKAKAAESAYYKTSGYGGPNYGKSVAGKSYTIAKVGPKLGVKHQTASEKKAEKAAQEQEKLLKEHPDFFIKQEAQKAKVAATPKLSTAEAGKTPNLPAAEKHGFVYASKVAGTVGDWHYSSEPAYVSSDEQLKDLQAHLATADIKHGLAAQKEFKWSINNMQGKGATSTQRNALYSYTGSGYQTVNDKLNSLPPGVGKTGSSTISNIDAAMAASPPLEGDVVLYRGFKDPHTVFGKSGKWNDVNVAGMEWSQRSYSSTSGALATAQSFAGYGGVVMRVIIPKEMQVHGINAKGGQHGGENEIILQRGLRYRVVADYGQHGNKRYIDVMVVPNPYAKSE